MATKSGTIAYSYTYSLFGTQESYTGDAIVYTNYTYRPDGLRHSIGNTVHLWDGANIVADVEGSDITVYFRGINLIYADEDGEQTYYHFNAHGDVIALTNADGEKVKTYAYDAFGEEYDISALDGNPFRYCGEYYDTVSGTIYLRARYYDPALGRFTQQDGWEFAKPEDPLSLNLYTYCWNNALSMNDSTGNWPRWITATVGAIATAVAVVATVAAAPAVAVGATVVAGVSAVAYVAQSHHYDKREEKNTGVPETEQDAQDAGWRGPDSDPPAPAADCHQYTSKDDSNVKYVSSDGHKEVIYNRNGIKVEDSRDMGTYNFSPSGTFWGDIGHFFADILPWILFGNDDSDPGPIINEIVEWSE